MYLNCTLAIFRTYYLHYGHREHINVRREYIVFYGIYSNFAMITIEKMKIHIYLLIIFHLILSSLAFADNIGPKQFTTDDGLSNDAVLCMYQDEENMLWLGTRNGLNLYNGNRFIVYKYKKGDPNCLYYDNVHAITGNGNGKIYILTNGISELDTRTGIFRTITTQDTDGLYFHKKLYFGLGRKLYTYDGKEISGMLELPDELAAIRAVGADDAQILIGTENHGVYCYRGNEGGFEHIIPKGKISSIFRDKDGRWWIGSWNDGLYIYDGRTVRNIRHRAGDQRSLSSNFVRSFCQDMDGRMWMGTFNGLNVYDPADGTFRCYSDKNGKSGSSSVWSVLCDHQGSIWAGTYFDGVYRRNEKENIFTHFKASESERSGLSAGPVNRFVETKDGDIWIATDGGGLNRYSPVNGHFEWYRNRNGSTIRRENITCLYYDRDNNTLWAGTHLGGLNRIYLKNGKFSNYRHSDNDVNTLNSDVVRDIVRYEDKLLIATDKGVCIFSPETGMAERLFTSGPDRITYANGVMVASDGKIWICGGTYGVKVYNPLTDKLIEYSAGAKGLSCNSINRTYQDSRGRIWLCTNRDGIDLYNPDTDSFVNLDQNNSSIASNCVYNAIELPSGKMLFTTDEGFSILNENDLTFLNYYRKNGIPLSSINEKALFITSHGDILIGGGNGMVSFREEDLYRTPESYIISPFRLSIHGKEIYAEEDGILEDALARTERIVLKPSQTMFSIEYVTSDYLSDDESSLEYFMDGLSKSWTEMEGRPSVSFTNLASGKYTLKVRQKNSMTRTGISEMQIVVLPPPYRSWWAILLYVLAGGAVLYIIIRNYKAHVHLVEALKYEKTHIEDIEELNHSKIRFFTNISHEFRTPLTLIKGNVEMLMQVRSFAPAVYNKILAIYKSSNQLQELITELLDFSKLDSGKMKIKVSEHNIVKFVYENYLLFREYAKYRKISFDFIKTEDVITLWFDPKQMQKVMNNLISNAIKHTPEGGRISVIVRRDNDEVVIEVNDNGDGISSQDLNHIFDRFYLSEHQKSSSYSGTGIGLSLTKGIVDLHHGSISVYSRDGEGSSFKVSMKTGNSHFSEEEMTAVEEAAVPEISVLEMSDMQDYVQIYESEDAENGKTMLVAEDNDELREMLAGIFSPMYRIITAADGSEALKKVKEEIPDIVLSDVLMPKMSGTDLCRSIKNDLETCHIPVVLLTARTTLQQNMDGLYSGADDYISKPFNVNILVARCNNLVNNRLRLKEKFSGVEADIKTSISGLSTNPLDKKLMDQVVKAIEGHIDETDFNVDSLVQTIGMSRSKLFSKLKSITGQTPADFILTIRLKYAAAMLKEHPELNISEISDRAGFSSPRQFSKFFKAKYGAIPQQWRKS